MVVGVPLPSPKEHCWLILLCLLELPIDPSASSWVAAGSPLPTGMPDSSDDSKSSREYGWWRGSQGHPCPGWVGGLGRPQGCEAPQGARMPRCPPASTGITLSKIGVMSTGGGGGAEEYK